MEAFVIACTAIALVLVVLWAVRWFQSRSNRPAGPEPTPAPAASGTPLLVVVELPIAQRLAFVSALAQRVDDRIRSGAAVEPATVTPLRDPEVRAQVVIDAASGPRVLDAVLGQLRAQGYRVDRTEGREIVLTGWAATEARVVVTPAGSDD